MSDQPQEPAPKTIYRIELHPNRLDDAAEIQVRVVDEMGVVLVASLEVCHEHTVRDLPTEALEDIDSSLKKQAKEHAEDQADTATESQPQGDQPPAPATGSQEPKKPRVSLDPEFKKSFWQQLGKLGAEMVAWIGEHLPLGGG